MAAQAAAAGINAVANIPMAVANPVVTKAAVDPFTALCCSPCSDFTICGYMPSSWQEGVLLIAAALNVAIFALAFFAGYYALATAAGITAVTLVFAASIASQLVALESLQATAKELENTNARLSSQVTDLTAQIELMKQIDKSLAGKLVEYDALLKRHAVEQGKLEVTTKNLQMQEALARQATEQALAATQASKDAALMSKFAAVQSAIAAQKVNQTVTDVAIAINPPQSADKPVETQAGLTPVEVSA